MSSPRQPRRSPWRTILIVAAILIAAALGFMTWYRAHFSMDVARAFETTAPESAPRVLVATQGSRFKDAIVAGLVENLQARPAYVKVIDVSQLPTIQEGEWNAIVLLHTWEMGQPPAAVQAFIARTQQRDKLVALTTSGSARERLQDVDAISSASTQADVPARVAEISRRVDAILETSAASERSAFGAR